MMPPLAVLVHTHIPVLPPALAHTIAGQAALPFTHSHLLLIATAIATTPKMYHTRQFLSGATLLRSNLARGPRLPHRRPPPSSPQPPASTLSSSLPFYSPQLPSHNTNYRHHHAIPSLIPPIKNYSPMTSTLQRQYYYNQRRDHPPRHHRQSPIIPLHEGQYQVHHHPPQGPQNREGGASADNGGQAESRRPSKQALIVGSMVAAIIFYFHNIETIPVSGRRRFNVMPEWVTDWLGDRTYKAMLEAFEERGGSSLPSWDPRTQMVSRVMRNLIPVSGMEDKDWQWHVVDDPNEANAIVFPGGKVVVFSGMFRVARTDSSIAAVLGHEIAHNLADHAGEQLSGNVGFNLLIVGLVGFASWTTPFLFAWLGKGVMDYVFGMPMSRVQESEADYIGLMMMAEACYDPRDALRFWKKMDAITEVEPPELLSTHPSHKNRVSKIEEWLPEAMEKRALSQCSGTSHFANKFRKALEQGQIILVQPGALF